MKILSNRKGSLVLGRQAGNLEAGEQVHRTNAAQSMFRHNAESFRKMWKEVGEATGTKWRVDVELFEVNRKPALFHDRPDGRAIRFSVWRDETV